MTAAPIVISAPTAAPLRRRGKPQPAKAIAASVAPLSGAVLSALSLAVVVVDEQEWVVDANPAAEALFDCSVAWLKTKRLGEVVASDSPLLAIMRSARLVGANVIEDGVRLDGPRFRAKVATVEAALIPEAPGLLALALRERSIALTIDRQLHHRNAARSVTALASVLAHEVKNPLAGIRGAAQLLEQNAAEDDRALAQLIVDETDRICKLVDRMDMFQETPSFARDPVNIHQALEYVRRIAQTGFARAVRFVERYDPSLPPVAGGRDQLVQVLLNLVKNAAEAVPAEGGEIILSTAFEHGVRLATPGGGRLQLPLVVSVQDNGPGVPEALRPHLFEPFVTTKPSGAGLGLALVAKIVNDHGGVIECDSRPGRTIFRLRLPLYDAVKKS